MQRTPPRCAEALDQAATDAGLVDEFKVVYPTIPQCEAIIANPLIQGVSMTGAVGPGKAVASIAGLHMKKAVFELGGSDPFIVLKDADIDTAAKQAVLARLMNTGQVCIAAKRMIVDGAVVEQFTNALLAEVANWTYGDPTTAECRLGPMARDDLTDAIERQLRESIDMGAQLLMGGERVGPAMITPAVLTNVTRDMPVFQEETFGPIIPILSASSEQEMIDIANDSEFGFGASIWTGDANRAAQELAPKIIAGSVFINDFVKSLVPVPFGAQKGAELDESQDQKASRNLPIRR